MTIMLQRMDFTVSQEFDLDPSNYVIWISGTLTGINEREEEMPIGNIQAIHFDYDEIDENGENIFDVADTSYFELSNFVTTVFDSKMQKYSGNVRKLFQGGIESKNLLYILGVQVIPEARGGNNGLAMILNAVQRFGKHCGLVGIYAAPQQFDSGTNKGTYQQMKLDAVSGDRATALRKLKAHYSKIGFKELNDDYMVLSPEFRLPSIYEVCENCLI